MKKRSLGMPIFILLVGMLVTGTSQGLAWAGTVSDHLLISEVVYDPLGTEPDEEWVEIYNPTSSLVDLSNYKIGDEETSGGTEGMFQFPSETSIVAGSKMVIASKATAFFALYGKKPNFELLESDPAVPNMVKYLSWASGNMALSNSGDEVLLLGGDNAPIDVLVYGLGSYTGIVPHSTIAGSHSLERSPANQDTDDCSVDFIDQVTPNPETQSAVTVSGDVDGNGKVDIFDLVIVAKAFGSTPGSSNWDPRADLNGDAKVDIFDLVIVAKNFGKSAL